MQKKFIFLDRDGTLIYDRPGHYLTRPEKLRFYKSAFKALRILSAEGYQFVILTNQSGIARRWLTERTLDRIHDKLLQTLKKNRISVSGIYYCPHAPEDRCLCRKPKTALARRAVRELRLPLKNAYVIGDKKADVDLGRNLRIPAILLKTGHGKSQIQKFGDKILPAYRAQNLLRAARWIVRQQAKGKR